MRSRRRSSFLGQYLGRDSRLHRLAPGTKLVLAAMISLGALLAARPMATLALALLCTGLYGAARLGWRALRQDAAIVVLHAPLVFGVFLWRRGLAGLTPALMVSVRLSLAALPGLWVQRTTRVTELAASLRRVLPARLAFVVAMSLRFLPVLARDAREIYLLQRLRGARIGARDLVNPLHWGEACHCLAVPLLIRASHLADQVAVAAEQRGVGGRSVVLLSQVSETTAVVESKYLGGV
jgi:energy-coupling factor transport system permease protein